jgi:RNA-directed DNA polymerase
MGLQLNRNRTRKVDAREEPFNFPGFIFRYDRDLRGRPWNYLNIFPAAKSEKKLRERIHIYLHSHGHYPDGKVAEG